MTTSLTANHKRVTRLTSCDSQPHHNNILALLALVMPMLMPLSALCQNTLASTTPPSLTQRYYDGDYATVANQGAALLLIQPWDNELRYFVANSLAWTGRTDEAIPQYQALDGTTFSHEAQLGLANIYRWNGRPDRAQPLYQQVLNDQPDNKDAVNGLILTQRELRPKTSISVENFHDSDQTSIHSLALKQQWRASDTAQQIEIEADVAQNTRPGLNQNQSDLTLRYANPNALLEPKAEVSLQTTPDSRLFGKLSLSLSGTPLAITAGRVNWAKLAQNPFAIAQGLTANDIGGNIDYTSTLGRWRATYLASEISDANLVQDASFLYTPAWQPFTSPDIKAYVGVNGHKARFATPLYWSPAPGNYYGLIGLNAEWVSTVWSNVVAAQYGLPLSAGITSSWSLTAGAHRHLGQDWALGIDLTAQSAQRSTAYSAQYVTFSLEKLW